MTIRATVDIAKGSVLLQHREDQPEGGYSTVRIDEVGSDVHNQRDAEAALKGTKWRIASAWQITQGEHPWVAVEPARIPDGHMWDGPWRRWTSHEWRVLAGYGHWLAQLSENEWSSHIRLVAYADRWGTVPECLHAAATDPSCSADLRAQAEARLIDIRIGDQVQRDREIGWTDEDDWTFGGHWR